MTQTDLLAQVVDLLFSPFLRHADGFVGHLIDHAKYGSGNIYIDAYGDEATGDFYSNEEVAKRRANTIVNYLIKEGIDPGRMYVRYLGCTRQPYGNNNLNRCVIVKIG